MKSSRGIVIRFFNPKYPRFWYLTYSFKPIKTVLMDFYCLMNSRYLELIIKGNNLVKNYFLAGYINFFAEIVKTEGLQNIKYEILYEDFDDISLLKNYKRIRRETNAIFYGKINSLIETNVVTNFDYVEELDSYVGKKKVKTKSGESKIIQNIFTGEIVKTKSFEKFCKREREKYKIKKALTSLGLF